MPLPINILFPFTGHGVGGSHVSGLLLAANLKPPFKARIILHQPGRLGDYLKSKGMAFSVHPELPFLSNDCRLLAFPWALSDAAWRLARFLRRERIGLVHSNDWPMHRTWMLPTVLTGGKLIWHQRGAWKPSRQVELFCALAARVVCVSRFVQRPIPRWLARKSVMVHNPFITGPPPDKARAARGLRRELGIPPTAAVVGCFANVISRKRPAVFRRVFDELLRRGWGGRVAFVWFGNDRDGLFDSLAGNLPPGAPAWSFLRVPFKLEIEKYMAGCDLALAPAVDEAFGRNLVECMLVRTPVIAAADGGHLEIIAHQRTGLLVEPDNHGAFAGAVEELLGDEKRRLAIGEQAREQAREHYGVERHVQAVQGIYRELLPRLFQGASPGGA